MTEQNPDEIKAEVATEQIDYFDGSEEVEAEPATLELIVKLAAESRELDSQIAEMQVALAELEAKSAKIKRIRLPEIMTTLGMEEYKLIDGSKVTIKESVNASITEENKPAAWKWLEERKFDGIIKTAVNLAFGKGEMEKATEVVKLLDEAGYHAELSKGVHPMTLKSFVKERLEAGDALPLDVFGVFEFKEAKITAPKKKK